MAGSVNKVILIGNIGKDPDIRHFEEGRAVATFPLATTESYTSKNGEKKEQTEWHNIAIWRTGLVGIVEKYLRKGNKVYLEGKLRTRSWEDQQKNTRYITEIIVDNLTLLGGPNPVNQVPANNNNNDDLPF